MVKVKWNDGYEMSAGSWTQMLQKVNDLPWNEAYTKPEMKEQLAKRAAVWDLRKVNPRARPRTLFHQLEKAGMLEIVT